MEKQRSKSISEAKKFIESLPEEISYVITKDDENQTETVGRDYIIEVLEAAQ